VHHRTVVPEITRKQVRAQVATYEKSAVGVKGRAAMDMKFCLAFQREALSVPVTRRVLGDILRAVGVDEDSVSDILLAATEACSNVLRHGGPRATGYAVVVTIGTTRCVVEVSENWNSSRGVPADDGFRLAGRLGGRRLPRPAAGLTVRGGRRRTRRAVHEPSWRGGSPAGGPAQGRKAQRRNDTVHAGRDADISRLPESGRGLDVMRACVDDVTMRNRPGQGTVVTMRKKIDWSSDSPLARLRAAS
jgi:anti-sigma regulatory factor (Ser/Thr protein kinase)